MNNSKKFFAVLDTETATLWGDVFDFGVVIVDKKGKIYDRMEFVVEEVFNNVTKMKKAFYFNKVDSFYKPNIRCGRMTLRKWADGMADFRAMLNKWNVKTICAYNLGFDRRVMIATSKNFGFGVDFRKYEMLDLWRVSCETILIQKTYKKLADSMGWKSEKGNYKTSAEVAYRYGLGDWNFDESHTALDDAMIEAELLAKIYRTKKKVNMGIKGNPWMGANKVLKAA